MVFTTLTYNDLPSVEDASGRLQSRSDFAEFLDEFAALAHRWGVAGVVGVFLLHRHFHLEESERICERHIVVDGSSTLASAPDVRRDTGQLPHRWAFAENTWLALEYSDDPAVARAQAEVHRFMPAFAGLLRQFYLEESLGLALISRDSLSPLSHQVYMEETTETASVLRCVEETEELESFLNTLWIANPENSPVRCRGWSRCRPEGAPPNDRHVYAYGHDRES